MSNRSLFILLLITLLTACSNLKNEETKQDGCAPEKVQKWVQDLIDMADQNIRGDMPDDLRDMDIELLLTGTEGYVKYCRQSQHHPTILDRRLKLIAHAQAQLRTSSRDHRRFEENTKLMVDINEAIQRLENEGVDMQAYRKVSASIRLSTVKK